MQLNPRESFTVVRQIEDHSDSSQYYVRAVIRNAKTDAIIDTLNLTDNGSRRFTKNWLVPADPSGQGFWVSILTSVYTDSGYTTKSQNYGDKMEVYLIQERQVFNPNYPIPTGPDISYQRIEKIVEDKIKKIVPTIVKEPKETKPVDILTPLRAVQLSIETAIAGIEKPKPVDLSPITKRIDDLEKLLTAHHKDNGDKRESSMEEMMDCVDGVIEDVKEIKRDVLKQGASANEVLLKVVKDSLQDLNNKLAQMKIQFTLKDIDIAGQVVEPKPINKKNPDRVNKMLRK